MGRGQFAKIITDRDRELLAWTGQAGVASVDQLARRFWPNAREDTARDRLQQLTCSGYLATSHYHDGQQARQVYSLTKRGRDLFAPAHRERLQVGLPAAHEIKQQLLAQEVRIKLEREAVAAGGRLVDWKPERELRSEANRGYAIGQRHGQAERVEIADARAIIQQADGSTQEIDIEIDGQYYGQMLRDKVAKLGAGPRPVLWACEAGRTPTIQAATAGADQIQVFPL